MATHILFESASGYAIFEVKLREEIAAMTEAVQKSIQDLGKFKKMVSLVSFSPFKSAAHALENANDVSEGAWTMFLPHIDLSIDLFPRRQARSTRTSARSSS
jgi:nucleolar protein 56